MEVRNCNTPLYRMYKLQVRYVRILEKLLEDSGISLSESKKVKVKLISVTSSITPEKIIELVEDEFKSSVLTRNRRVVTTNARKASAFLLSNYAKSPLVDIAPLIGLTHHTSVMHNIRECEDLMETDYVYNGKMQTIIKDIKTYIKNIKH